MMDKESADFAIGALMVFVIATITLLIIGNPTGAIATAILCHAIVNAWGK